ncbi:FHA domain-containing protein [Nocardioides antri]|uniref:FHA domain-containing protein n=1 Tax=Nocardioides antri TaxID=2607659 RepID=A0A5B1M1V4_9ACTN|nr:FHA domain-containing protein [Nocardioides antri]KAA1426741.1 FHA domain-containing protein [Nocardioides antri]
MTPLQIEAGGRSFTFDGTRPVTIGREPGSDVILTGDTVSRRHAEIRPDGTGWTLVDVGSSSGTFSGGTRVTELRLSGQGTVRIGGAAGEELRFTVVGARPATSAADVVLPPPGLQQTVVPGGALPGSFVPGPALLVRTGGSSRRFVPGTTVRIGRDPANEVVVDDSSVSRLHAVVESRPDGWWYVDRSSAGTFDGEDRVSSRKLTGPLTLMLGHPTAGVEVEVVPVVAAREAQKALAGRKRKRTALLVGGIAAAVLLVGGGITAAALLAGDDDEGGGGGDPTTAVAGLTESELDRAKSATVFLVAVSNGEPTHTGSGAIISDDGLILTNAHVADPGAPGFEPQDVSPDYLVVGIVPADDPDAPVELRYRAAPVATDGPLDLSVLRIDGDLDGNPVEGDLDLPEPLPIGDSEEVRTGDELVALGYPGLASVDLEDPFARSVTVTEGVASTIKAVPPFGEDAWIESDLRLGSGNSGGPTINDDGEIIGVNTEVRTRETQGEGGEGGVFTSGSALMRPTEWAEPVVAAAESGATYSSEWVDDVGADTPPDMGADAGLAAGGWSLDGAATCSATTSTADPQILAGAEIPGTVYAEFAAVGVPDGTPLELQFFTVNGSTQLGSTPGVWEYGPDETCVAFPVDIAEPIEGIAAVLVIGDLQVVNPVRFQ